MNVVKTYKIVPGEPRRGEIGAKKAGTMLSPVFSAIWSYGKKIDRGVYPVGEHLYCDNESCNPPSHKFDERCLPREIVPKEALKSDSAETQIKAVIQTHGLETVRRICNNPQEHIGDFRLFWSTERTIEFVSKAVSHAGNESRLCVSRKLLLLGSPYVVGWVIAYTLPTQKWLNYVTLANNVNLESEQIFYIDTIGRNTRIKNLIYRNIIYPYGMLEVLEALIPAFVYHYNNGVPIIFRSSQEKGPHVLKFASGFFEKVEQIGISTIREGREYYRAIKPQMPGIMISLSRRLPGASKRVSALQHYIANNLRT